MKIIILYDSKRGSTEECALKLSQNLNCDSKKVRVKIDMKDYDLDSYDHIVIGTPMYVGRPLKSIINFINNNVDLLKTKQVSFFLCGLGNHNEMIDAFKKVINSDLINDKTIIRHFGGELHPERARFIMKSIMEKMLQDPKFKGNIDDKEIDVFIKDVRKNTKKS